jgi:hypothetical protein
LSTCSRNAQISNFMKIRSVGAEFFHADGRTDMTKLRSALRNFSNAPKHRYFSACNYLTYFIRVRLHKGFLITFGKLLFEQYSASISKYLTQLHHVNHTLQAVDQKGYCTYWSLMKTDMPFRFFSSCKSLM